MGRKRKKDQSDKFCLGRMKKNYVFHSNQNAVSPQASSCDTVLDFSFYYSLELHLHFKIINVMGKTNAYFASKC